MILAIDAISDTGCVREHNEDMVLAHGQFIRDDRVQFQMDIDSPVPAIFAVADGVGGHNGGEFASELALLSLDEFVRRLPVGLSYDKLKGAFRDWVQTIHREIIQKGIDLPEFFNMGTTLVGLLFYENSLYWLNAGDSRLYRFRMGILSQVSSDHSMKKMFDPAAPPNMICNSIGAGKDVFIDFFEMPSLFDGDLFLLCSDGLSDMLPDNVTESMLIASAGAEQLAEAAREAGGRDNISVLMLRVNQVDTFVN